LKYKKGHSIEAQGIESS